MRKMSGGEVKAMEYRPLGKTGLEVSLLSLGTLTMGPFQAGLTIDEGAHLIGDALSMGVNLVDTAELYSTYEYIKHALMHCRMPAYIASKSYAVTAEEMEASLAKALSSTERSTIDLFMLHQQESALTLRGHRGALEYLIASRKKGLVKAVGISTHHIAAVKAITTMEEIDFVFAPLNVRGLGIQDGTADEMITALSEAHGAGKGILIMKPLGGGHLRDEPEKNFHFLRGLSFVSSIVVGLQDSDELLADYQMLHGIPASPEIMERLKKKRRSLHIEDCQGCGCCMRACPYGALALHENHAIVDDSRCLLCGYCAAHCPEFCIKVV
jgi:predicted aldo/keto reductase-like oxidoreductase